MYIGTILSVDEKGTKGTVELADSDDVYPFDDDDFPQSGLKVDDKCMFDLNCDMSGSVSCVATNLEAIELNVIIIDTPHTGNIDVGQTDKVIIKTGGEVNGNINISGGILKMNGGNVNGNVNGIAGGLAIVKQGSTIYGHGVFNNARIKLIGGLIKDDLTLKQVGEGLLKTGGEVVGNINISSGILRINDGGRANNIDVQNAECDVVVQPTGEVVGNLNISPGSKIKITG